MTIANLPPLSQDAPHPKSLGDFPHLSLADVPDSPEGTLPASSAGDPLSRAEVHLLYRQMELRLERIVEMLLRSKIDEGDNILAGMQEVVERVFVTTAVRMAEGNISKAARLLGINRNTLSRKLRSASEGVR